MKLTSRVLQMTFLIVAGLATSCALKPIPSDYSSIRLTNIDATTLGNGTVLIYNGADILHGIDNTARLNILIGDKSIGQIRKREYVVLQLEKGKYDFNVLHVDVVKMRSQHTIEIDENTKIIRIEPTITSNKLTVTNELPKNFEKYSNVLDRE